MKNSWGETRVSAFSLCSGPARVFFPCLLALVLLATGVFAQERFGEIQGTATDATGAVVPNVTVTLTETNVNRVQTTKTGGDGSYVFRSVEPGPYKVRFDLAGFNPMEVPNVNVLAGRVLTVNSKLEVGGTGQTVQVTEAAPLIDVTTPLVAQNLSAGEFDRLPKSRTFQSLAITSPNVNTGGVEAGIQVNGASASENQFVVDGISTNSLVHGHSRQNAAFEILQEVQVKTAGIEAQYGGALGGVISAITRSGGNDFHGDIHYYFSGSALNAGPPKRLLMDASDLTTVSYVQDWKNPSKTHEIGYALGGRFIRNKLFFFSAASPQYNKRRDYRLMSGDAIPQMVTLKSDTTFMQAYNKVSFTPFSRLTGSFGWLWSPSHQEGILPAQSNYGNQSTSTAASLLVNQGRGYFAPQSTYSGNIDISMTPTTLLQLRGAYFWDNYKALGIPNVSAVEWGNSSQNITSFQVPGDLRRGIGSQSTPRVQTTLHDLVTRSMYQADFSQYIGHLGGSHDLKIGLGRMKNVNNVDISYPGGGYVTLWWDTAFEDPVTKEQRRGTYGYYQVDDIGTKGSTGGTIDNIYVQDRWRPVRRLSLDLGVRLEKEVVPSFRRDIRDKAFEFGWGEKIAPRLGASYDLFGDGRVKLYGSWGVFYDWVKYELSRGTFGGDVWHTMYRSLDTLDVLSLSGTNMPGRNLFGAPFRDWRIPSFGEDTLDPNIKPMSSDLTNAGVEFQLSPSSVFAARYTRNHLRNTIEDIGTVDATGSEVYIYGNPGQGLAKKTNPSYAVVPSFDIPKAVRTYNALELSLHRRFSNKWFGSVSYVYSRLYGNYSGLTSTDEVTPPATNRVSGVSQQSSGQYTRPGTSASRYYDSDFLMWDARGNFDPQGRLASDRPHVFKMYGSYIQPWKAGSSEIGVFFNAQSGTPMTTFVATNQNSPIMVNGRGDMGRTPIFNRTDLVLAHEIRKFGEGRALRFEFNAQNLFNQKISQFTYNYYNRYRTTSSGISLSTTDFRKAYDWQALLANTADASKSYGAKDPRFSFADYFSTGFVGRFGVKFIF
jgi:hypothetical protein